MITYIGFFGRFNEFVIVICFLSNHKPLFYSLFYALFNTYLVVTILCASFVLEFVLFDKRQNC